MRGINTTKLLVLAILGFCALVLGSAVLTLQIHVTQEKRRLGLLGKRIPVNPTKDSPDAAAAAAAGASAKANMTQNNGSVLETISTTKPSAPLEPQDLHLSSSRSYPPPQGSNNPRVVQEAYWRQAAAALQEWDALLFMSEEEPRAFRTGTVHGVDPQFALKQAADAGHPMAQHYVANAYASGIWPVKDVFSSDEEDNESSRLNVLEEWSPTTQVHHPQLTQAFLYWHMAAMGGNVESSAAMAHRIDRVQVSQNKSPEEVCQEMLPYLEAAAHGIMDALEASPNSRAKALPPMDKHTLAQVHMHGGTSSQLDSNNKPYETKEAIQFYHLKATTTSWHSSADDPVRNVKAAHTLARLYHHGQVGVAQNLTQALFYYEIAARNNHWEDAGEAGTFHLWGMGTPQNSHKALEFFHMAVPYPLGECRRRFDKLRKSKENNIHQCDASGLNGLGVLHLLGIEGKISVDLEEAEKYFSLAKEMGHPDAMYNLSMMWLGWKTHFKHFHELKDDGVSEDPQNSHLDSSKSKHSTFALHYSERTDTFQKGPLQSEIQEAVKLLGQAYQKGHIQAAHRLAMIYSEGIQIQSTAMKYDAIKPSCTNAKKHYLYITEKASPWNAKRLRKAYQAYMDGDLEVSLRNYLAVAETGSDVGQVNAAFLLERGVCLGMSSTNCAKASVRLWKAAAERGNPEASMRVGDFYYYGRLRGNAQPVGPFAWVDYVLFPEKYLPVLLANWSQKLEIFLRRVLDIDVSLPFSGNLAVKTSNSDQDRHDLQSDLSTAAHYYMEAERYKIPRANFNLAFMYEWGLGLKQDFPLAKRHYDLAASLGKNHQLAEANIAVKIALWAMSVHQYVVKWSFAWEEWQKRRTASPSVSPTSTDQWSDHPLAGKTAQDVFVSHMFNWSSLIILILLCIVVKVQAIRMQRRLRR